MKCQHVEVVRPVVDCTMTHAQTEQRLTLSVIWDKYAFQFKDAIKGGIKFLQWQDKAAPTFPGVEWQHSVSEATRGMRHRHCAIAHGIQLVQPTRLKAGGHEQKITGCSDFVAHGHIEANPASCSIWICAFQPSHACLQIDLQLFRAGLGLITFIRLSNQSLCL